MDKHNKHQISPAIFETPSKLCKNSIERNTCESPESKVFFNFELHFHPWLSIQYAEFPEIIAFGL